MKLTALMMFVFTGPVVAQYYEERPYEPSDARLVHAGLFMREFLPRGSNDLPAEAQIRYNRIMPTIGFRQGSFDLTFGYARFRQVGRNRETIFLGATFMNEFSVAGKRAHALIVPIVLATDYTKAESPAIGRSGGPVPTRSQDFNIGSLGIGAGLKYRYNNGGVECSIGGVAIAQYSFEGLGTGSGFSPAAIAEGTLLLRDAMILDGIALGYRLRFQSWSMSNAAFDYRSLSHGPYLGLMF